MDARAQLAAALATFTRLGAAAWARRAEAELRATGMTSRRARARAPPSGSPRRSCRWRWSSRTGATNSEAAARLFLSAKTIEYHLSNVYRKLGIRSRVELARRMMAGPEQPVPTPTLGTPPPNTRAGQHTRPHRGPGRCRGRSAPPAPAPAAGPEATISSGPAAARPPAMA